VRGNAYSVGPISLCLRDLTEYVGSLWIHLWFDSTVPPSLSRQLFFIFMGETIPKQMMMPYLSV